MVERVAVDTRQSMALLRPAAGPVDTFVNPGPSPLRGLAEALAKIDKPLADFMAIREAKKKEGDTILGEAAGFQNNGADYKELVSSGKLPANQSPYFMKGYKNTQGVVAGRGMMAAFNTAFDEWDGKNSDDPAAYETFVADFLSKNITTEDPDVLRGLLPQVRELHAAGYARYTDYRHKQVYEGALKTGGALVSQDINEATKDGLSTPEGTDYTAVWGRIEANRTALIEAGTNPNDVDKAMMEAVAAKALELEDEGLLDFFKQKVPGTDMTYGDTPDGIAIKEQARNSLEVKKRQSAVERKQAQEAADKAALDGAKSNIQDVLAADPKAPIPDDVLAIAKKYDPEITTKIAGWRADLARGVTDDKALSHVYDEVMKGRGVEAVYEAQAAGVFGRPEDLKAAREFALSFDNDANRKKIEDALSDNTTAQILKDIDQRTKGKSDFGDPITGMSNEGYEAQYDLKRAVTEWVTKNPNATYMERQEAITKMGVSILGRISVSDPLSDVGGAYDRPADATFENPYSALAPGEAPPAPAASAAPSAPATPANPDGIMKQAITGTLPQQKAASEELTDLFAGMTPEQKANFEAAAKAQGMTAEELMNSMADDIDPTTTEGIGQEDASAAKPISYVEDTGRAGRPFTQQEAMTFLQQALSEEDLTPSIGSGPVRDIMGDPRASRLGALLRKAEAAGNYNAVFGNARSKKDLSKLTLNQVLASQVAARKRGVRSTAIGGYQFIYKTLRGLKGELGLTGNERFTPELQDQLFGALMERRGWSSYKEGRISARQFSLRLSQEWASVANPNTGLSYYAGDGLNAASVRTKQVYAALGV